MSSVSSCRAWRRFLVLVNPTRFGAVRLGMFAAVTLTAALSAVLSAADNPGTRLFDLHGVAKALKVGTSFNSGGKWVPQEGSALQRKLLARLPQSQADLARIPELWGFAAPTADPINQALAKAGFDIRLQPWPNDGQQFGVAALLKMQVRWRVAGETHEKGDKHPFTVVRNKPAFRLTTDSHGVMFGSLGGAREPVVIVPTTSGDTLFLLRTDEIPKDGFALFELAEAIARSQPSSGVRGYAGVYLPMVNANKPVDLSWMIGLRAGTWRLSQALQQVKFKMNQLGATVESGTAFGGETGALPTYYKLDGPFMVAITRLGVRTPIFAGYIGLDSFGDPS